MPMTSGMPRASAQRRWWPNKSTLNAVTVFYKMNPWVQFGFEERHYASYALPNTKDVCTTKIAGLPNCTSIDWRTEFGPVFTF